MARVVNVVTGTVIDATTFGNALITDYLSQTDVNDQNVASDIEIVNGKELRTNTINETTAASGVTIDTVTIKDGAVDGIDVSAHAVASTGVHGAGGDTLATDADIVTHAALDTGVHGAGGDTLATDADITTHAALDTGVHGAGASTLATVANITTHNSSASAHGCDGNNTHFWRGDNTWAVPTGTAIRGWMYYVFGDSDGDATAYDRNGNVVYGGSGDAGGKDEDDHQAVCQACLDNLSADRTFKETVIFDGNLEFDSAVNVDESYTRLLILGTLTRSANVEILHIGQSSITNNAVNQYVEVCGGGILDGASETEKVVAWNNCKSSSLHNLNFRNFDGYGLYTDGHASTASYRSFYNRFYNLHFGFLSGSGYTANASFVYIGRGSIDNTWSHFIGGASGLGGGNQPIGIFMQSGGGHYIEDVHFDDMQNNFYLQGDVSQIQSCTITGCYIDRPTQHGIVLDGDGNGILDVHIVNNNFFDFDTGYSMVYLDQSDSGDINDCLIGFNRGQGTTHKYCIEGSDNSDTNRLRIIENTWHAGATGRYVNTGTDVRLNET